MENQGKIEGRVKPIKWGLARSITRAKTRVKQREIQGNEIREKNLERGN